MQAKKRIKSNLGNVTQNLSKKEMANIGQIWPDILVPFVNDYNVKLTASDVSRSVTVILVSPGIVATV